MKLRKKRDINIFTITILLLVTFSLVNNVKAQAFGEKNIGVYPTNNSFEDVVVSTNYAYITENGGDYALRIFSIVNPINPTLIGSGARYGSDSAHCIDVNPAETIAIVGASNNVYIFNVILKDNPNRTKEINVGSTVYDVEISGNYVYCAAYSSGLPIINITDLNNPTLLFDGKYSGYNQNYLRDIHVDDAKGFIYAAGGNNVLIFQINSSGLPELYSSVDIAYTAYSVYKISDTRLVAGNSYGQVYFIDITNPASPSVLGMVDIGSYVHDLYYADSTGNLVFAADYADGLNIINYHSFTNPEHVGIMGTTTGGARGYGIDCNSNYAVLAAGSYGLLIYRLSDCLNIAGEGMAISGYPLLFLTLNVVSIIIFIVLKNRNSKVFHK